jgi:LacI family transcriptional regulator
MLSRKNRPTAIVVQGTGILSSTLNAIAQLGLRIPDDISLVSIGHADFIKNHVPAITNLHIDYERLSAEIPERLFALLDKKARRERPSRLLFPYVFEVSGSTAAPRRKA